MYHYLSEKNGAESQKVLKKFSKEDLQAALSILVTIQESGSTRDAMCNGNTVFRYPSEIMTSTTGLVQFLMDIRDNK